MSLLTTVERRGADTAVAHTLQVTPDNFVRAETDMQFMTVVKRGGFGRLTHEREFPPVGRQALPWADGDVLRSRGVFDLELGPVVVTVPAGRRPLRVARGARRGSLHAGDVLRAWHVYLQLRQCQHALRAHRGARSWWIRPIAPTWPRVHALQDRIVVARQGGGRFVIPNWDPVSQAKVRVALQLLGNTVAGDERTFGGARRGGPGAAPDRHRHAVGPMPAARHRLSTAACRARTMAAPSTG